MLDVRRHNSAGPPLRKQSRRKQIESDRLRNKGHLRFALLFCSITVLSFSGIDSISYRTWIEYSNEHVFHFSKRTNSNSLVHTYSSSDVIENPAERQTMPQNHVLDSHVNQFASKEEYVNYQADQTKPKRQLNRTPKHQPVSANMANRTNLDESIKTDALVRKEEDPIATLEGQILNRAARERSPRSTSPLRSETIVFGIGNMRYQREHQVDGMKGGDIQREVAYDVSKNPIDLRLEETIYGVRDRSGDFSNAISLRNKPRHSDSETEIEKTPRSLFTATYSDSNTEKMDFGQRSFARSALNETNSGRVSKTKRAKSHKKTSPRRVKERAFKGHHVPSSVLPLLFRSDNITRVSLYAYRLIKAHRIESMIDLSCETTKHWMPAVLQYLEFEVPGFRFHCVVDDDKSMSNVMDYYRHLGSIEFLVGMEYNLMKFPKVHLAFLWNVIGVISSKREGHLFKGISKARIKYVLLSNYPNIKKNPCAPVENGRVNVRRTPYTFRHPLRIIQNVSMDPSLVKQILFFDVANIKKV
jgi:hypothetical protein